MGNLDRKSFEEHKNCTEGDSIIASDTDNTEYRGTVMNTEGSTVYVQSNEGRMLEFRRLKDSGNPIIVLGIGGKNSMSDAEITKSGRITKESSKLSFDTQIVEFTAEHQQHTIG